MSYKILAIAVLVPVASVMIADWLIENVSSVFII